jgi:hypothetical protein
MIIRVINIFHKSISGFYNRYFRQVIILIILSFVLAKVGFGQEDNNNWQTIIQTSIFTELNNPKKIDKNLLSKFPEWKGMSKRNGKFNASDIGSGPRRRIYFIANSENHWIISYEHGGRGYHTHCFLITINNQNNLVTQNISIKFESFEYLKAFIKTDNGSFTNHYTEEY